MEWHHIGSVRQGLIGIGMHFHKEAIDSNAGCRAGQWLNELTLATGLRATAARQLHTMGGVEDHWVTEAPKDWKRPHIDDEIIVTER